MNLLMLRGQVPQDRNPSEIVFDKIQDVDDMWSQLFYAMIGRGDFGELWYWGGKREKKFSWNFTERWVPSFKDYHSDFVPDLIFCRGGFKEYHCILKRFPKAIKVYYGAGVRFLPQPGFDGYDLILQDSEEQLKICKEKYPKVRSTLFIKPAADNLFFPVEVKKQYDVCFPANGAQPFKGHDFVYSTIPKDLSLLNLGNNPSKIKYPGNVTSFRVLRAQMAKHICRCKVGIVAVSGKIDSCPRVIPEMLACGLPIIVLDQVRFWKFKYIVSGVSGELANKGNFWDVVRMVLKNCDNYSPRKYYVDNLSINYAAKFIEDKVLR